MNLALEPNEVPDLRARVGWDRRDADYPVLFERCQFWAACRDAGGALAAFGYVAGMGLEHGYLEDVIVDPAYQRRGLGTALVLALLAEARRRGIEIVTATFDAAHLKFYESCGFQLGHAGVWRARSSQSTK